MDLTDRRLERQYRRYVWLSRLGVVVASMPWWFDMGFQVVVPVVVVLALVEAVFWCLDN